MTLLHEKLRDFVAGGVLQLSGGIEGTIYPVLSRDTPNEDRAKREAFPLLDLRILDGDLYLDDYSDRFSDTVRTSANAIAGVGRVKDLGLPTSEPGERLPWTLEEIRVYRAFVEGFNAAHMMRRQLIVTRK